jgi:hypothetical protein
VSCGLAVVSLGGVVQRWLRGEREQREESASAAHHEAHQAPWWKTLWLTGVDYFSSLGYAPGLAFLAAGYVAPIATLLLVLVTFAAAVPVYAFVAKHSAQGEGSIKMIERLTTGWGGLGWFGKTLVLVLLGFAITDFVLTITLSAADATLHIIENPFWPDSFPRTHVGITCVLIALLCGVFLKGFKEAIGLALMIALPYMILNGVIIAAGLLELSHHPEMIDAWWIRIVQFDTANLHDLLGSLEAPSEHFDPLNWIHGRGPIMLALVCLTVFPKLALGMSGFETGVSVMPHISGKDEPDRIRNTRRMLVTAAAIMCTELIGSSIVTTLVIPASEFASGGGANGRALAYLAHGLVGELFGSIYDLATVAILWFAGASAMAGLLNIIPRYLPRFGMSPEWIEYPRPLVLVVTAVCIMVTIAFDANVEAQGAAYATGVLVLMASGALAVTLAEWERRGRRYVFLAILGVFAYVLVVNVIERPDGIRIAGLFITATVVASIWSRWRRRSEIRIQGFAFEDAASEKLWSELRVEQALVLIPLRTRGPDARSSAVARSILHLEVEKRTTPCFLHVELTEDPSTFASPIRVKVRREMGDVIIEVKNAVAVANAIAYVAMSLGVEEVVIGLLEAGTPLVNSVMYLFFGTGEVGYAVRQIFMRIREERHDDELRRRRAFDKKRDKIEIEALREMLDSTPDERETLRRKLFEEEAKLFSQIVPDTEKLPRLILLG